MASSTGGQALAGIKLILDEMRDDRRRSDERFEGLLSRMDAGFARMDERFSRMDERFEAAMDRWDEDRKRSNRIIRIAVLVAKDIWRTLKEHTGILRRIDRRLQPGDNGKYTNGK